MNMYIYIYIYVYVYMHIISSIIYINTIHLRTYSAKQFSTVRAARNYVLRSPYLCLASMPGKHSAEKLQCRRARAIAKGEEFALNHIKLALN